MKSHAFITLTVLFTLFVSAKGEENVEETKSGTVRRRLTTAAWGGATSNNLQLGKTPTEISFSFTPGSAVPSSKVVVIAETNSVALWASSGDAVACLTTQGGAALSIQPSCVATNAYTLTCTPSTQIESGAATVMKCTTNIAANAATFKVVTFEVTVGSDTQLNDKAGWKAGVVSIYYIKSECREAGKTSGSLEDCGALDPEANSGGHCKYCTGGNDKFVVRTGLQQEGTTCSGSVNTRCDSLYFSDTSVDVAFSTNGNTGRITCGAYLYEDSAPTPAARNIEYESFGTEINDLRSKNSVEVSVEGAETDHVMTLNGLSPDVRYLIRCHGEAMANMAEDLVVWTDINLDVWDISLTPDVLTTSATPTELILTFRHGATLTGHASLTTITMVTDQDVFATASATSTTCTMHSQAVGGTNNQVTQFSAVTQNSEKREIKFAILAGGASAALSKVTIRCTSNLGANVAVTNPVVINSLAVVSAASANKHAAYTHRTVEKVYGYKTTPA